MIEKIYYKTKVLMRPITRQRRLLEKVRYAGVSILPSQEGNDFIANTVGQAFAIGKMGSSELAALRHYLRRKDSTGHCKSWGWQATNLHKGAGVYPKEPETLSRFCRHYSETLSHLDALGVWFNLGECAAYKRFAPKARLLVLNGIEPYYNARPWSRNLAGRRVLVISPFAHSIEVQFRRRQRIWPTKPDVLPAFDLITLSCPPQSFLVAPVHRDWFAALNAMCEQMSTLDFDCAIVGAGAWSLALVAHAKSLGKWAIHLGGGTQVLFGMKGGRWEKSPAASFFNESWVRPSTAETPVGVKQVENGSYW